MNGRSIGFAMFCILGLSLCAPSARAQGWHGARSGQASTGHDAHEGRDWRPHHHRERQDDDYSGGNSSGAASGGSFAGSSGGGAGTSAPNSSSYETAVGLGQDSSAGSGQAAAFDPGADASGSDSSALADAEPALDSEERQMEQEDADLADEADPPSPKVKAQRVAAESSKKETAVASVTVACRSEKGLFCDAVISDDAKTAACLLKYRDNVLSRCADALDAWSARFASR